LSGIRVTGALPPFTHTSRTCDIFFNPTLDTDRLAGAAFEHEHGKRFNIPLAGMMPVDASS
jgi:hypothetical protein